MLIKPIIVFGVMGFVIALRLSSKRKDTSTFCVDVNVKKCHGFAGSDRTGLPCNGGPRQPDSGPAMANLRVPDVVGVIAPWVAEYWVQAGMSPVVPLSYYIMRFH